jgi:hypothetical protein
LRKSKISSDSTLAIGDSSGTLHFCDTTHGIISQSIKSQFGVDILTLAYNSKEDKIYASGVNGMVSQYKKSENKWVFTMKKNPHFHDVNHLELTNDGTGT